MNKKSDEELHKPIIRKSNKEKVYPPFIDNIWGAGLANMQLISKFKLNKHGLFLVKKGITIIFDSAKLKILQMIFFKLTDQYKISDIYINHINYLGHMSITQLL